MSTTTTPERHDEALWADEPAQEGRARFRARVGGLHCSLCTGTLERALGRHDGVHQVSVSLTHEQALVEYDPRAVGPDELAETLRAIGYPPSDPRKVRPYEEEEVALVTEGKRLLVAVAASLIAIALTFDPAGWVGIAVPSIVGASLVAIAFLILRPAGTARASAGSAGLGALVVALLVLRGIDAIEDAVPWAVGALALGMVFGLARHIAAMAVESVRRRILNQHVMLEAGALAGIAGGLIGLIFQPADYPAAAFFAVSVLVATYHLFSEWLSLLVKTRSSQAVKRLLDLQPDTANLVRDGETREVPIAEIAAGDLVRVRPGERVPVDGRVHAGRSAVDQSLVTGEPVPVDKLEGDEVTGGAINGSGSLLIEVTAVGEESFLSQIVRHVEDARALKPGILHLVDRVLRVYTPTVLSLSLLALLGWLGGSAIAGDLDAQRAVFASLAVLVMGYPCAMGIAAPLSIVRGSGEAADQGIIMRTGEAFQTLRLVERIALDKTGTLTEGRPVVSELATLGTEDELLTVAAGAESASEHPLAAAVVDAALDRGLAVGDPEEFESHTGLGIEAVLDGHAVLVGRPAFLTERGVDLRALEQPIERLEAQGRTVIVVSRDGAPMGAIALGDQLRSDAAKTVQRLRDLGVEPVLITGDNERAARHLAREAGIDEVHASVHPDDKATILRDLQQRGRVAMVGDGINDAPALMQADVGIAMGGGTDIAMESADVIITGDHLEPLLTAREISRTSYRKVKQNVTIAFTFNGIGVPLATTGLVYPVWAMIAMAVSVSLLFINSLWGRPDLLIGALLSVGRGGATDDPERADPGAGVPPPGTSVAQPPTA
ncbi:MAG: heavy metal translocating P-type ATPase [Egibacteraceae bacterium]